MDVTRQLSLIKGKHRYVFRYRAGCEEELVDALATMANDPASDFDWFDAAVLSYQMGRRIEAEVEQLRPKE